MNFRKNLFVSFCFLIIVMCSTGYAGFIRYTHVNDNTIIYNPDATYSDTQFLFQYQVTKLENFYRVYIDANQDPNTGFKINGIGADYLLENNGLFKYVGPGWNWQRIGTPTHSKVNNLIKWVINRSDIGNMDCAATIDFVYQVQTDIVTSSSPKFSLAFTSNPNCNATITQKIIVPSYFYPCTGSSCYWTQLNNSIPKVDIAIINPGSGPGGTMDPNYKTQTQTTQALGGKVIGYVDTAYATRSIAIVQSEIDKFYSWYNVDGIFFDQGFSQDCSKQSYYATLNTYVKSKGGKGITIINYGTNTPECYINASDILVTFESPYTSYVNWVPNGWYANYSRDRFWHIVYKTSQDNVVNVVNLAKQRFTGYVYVTDDDLPNPFDTLPSQNYWNIELNALS